MEKTSYCNVEHLSERDLEILNERRAKAQKDLADYQNQCDTIASTKAAPNGSSYYHQRCFENGCNYQEAVLIHGTFRSCLEGLKTLPNSREHSLVITELETLIFRMEQYVDTLKFNG